MRLFSNSQTGNALLCPKINIGSSFRMVCMVLLMTLLSSFRAEASNSTSVPVSDFAFGLVVPNVMLNEGQSVEIEITVGDPNLLAYNVGGFELWVELEPTAAIVGSLSPSVSNTWLSQDGNPVKEAKETGNFQRFHFRYDPATASNGAGTVLRFTVTATVDSTPAAKLIHAAGGLMIIDNLDVRQSAPAASNILTPIRPYPNPSTAVFNLNCDAADVAELSLFSLEGQFLRTMRADNQVDLEGCLPGTYLLRIRDHFGKTYFLKLIKL
jgi:hypothetical protein